MSLIIENIEWASYFLRDLFKLNVKISYQLLDKFIELNQKQPTDQTDLSKKKIISFILDDKLFEQNYSDLIINDTSNIEKIK
jgi:hypothetical protein